MPLTMNAPTASHPRLRTAGALIAGFLTIAVPSPALGAGLFARFAR